MTSVDFDSFRNFANRFVFEYLNKIDDSLSELPGVYEPSKRSIDDILTETSLEVTREKYLRKPYDDLFILTMTGDAGDIKRFGFRFENGWILVSATAGEGKHPDRINLLDYHYKKHFRTFFDRIVLRAGSSSNAHDESDAV